MPNGPATPWWQSFEARLVLGALLLRLVYLATILNTPFFDHPVNDEMQYDAWAQALAAGQPYLGNYPFWDAPGYAYVLGSIYWLFGHNLLAVRLIQVIVGTINVMLLYRLALRIFDPTVAVVVGLLAATYLPFLYYEGLLLKESIALFLVTSGLLLLVGALAKPTPLAFWSTGVVLGCLSLNRINALSLVAAALLVIWLRTPARRMAALALLLGTVMAIAPVTLRNWIVSEEWVPISVAGGQVLFAANNPDNTTGDSIPTPGVRFSPVYERIDFHRRAEAEAGRRLTPSEMSAHWKRKALDFMREHPGTMARMVGHRVLRFWNEQEIPDNHSILVFKQLSWVLRSPLPGYWLIAPFALIGLFVLRPRWRECLPLYAFLGLYMLSVMPTWVTSRYRLPIVSVMLILAGAAMVELQRAIAAAPPQWRWKPAAGLFTACLFCWMPMSHPPIEEFERHLAFAYVQNGQYQEAIDIYERLKHREQNQSNELFLAYAIGSAGQLDRATAMLTRLADPGQPIPLRHRAYTYLGDLTQRAGRWQESADAYRSALALDRSDYVSWNSLGVTLIRQDRFDDAERAFREALQQAPEYALAEKNLQALRQFRSRPGGS